MSSLYFSFVGGVGTLLVSPAANIIEQVNSTQAQDFRIYNTYTDVNNYERFVLSWSQVTNEIVFGTQASGTGANRTMSFMVGGSRRWQMNPSGNFICAMDNTYDIGLSAASRPRTGYFATSLLAPYVRTSTAYTVATLPAAGTAGAGARAYVTDANATTYLSIVAGGGANIVPVFSDGTNWKIG